VKLEVIEELNFGPIKINEDEIEISCDREHQRFISQQIPISKTSKIISTIKNYLKKI